MRETDWSGLDEWVCSKAGSEDSDSDRWMWWHMLDELIQGYLAYHVLEGSFEPSLLPEHAFWIVGIHDEEAHFWAFADRTDDDIDDIYEYMREHIKAMSIIPVDAEDAMEQVHMFQRKTLAAISRGFDNDGEPCTVLYYLPLFSHEMALGFLSWTASLEVMTVEVKGEDS